MAMSITLDQRSSAPATFRLIDLPRQPVDALYVHIPFCFHKCHYCDFYSITRQTPQRMASFVDLLLREAELWTAPDAPPLRPTTIFFGGGTPSLLPLNDMKRLLDGLRRRIDFSDVVEFTCEVNPATANLEYCRMLRESGVNRLSFGAQSFDRHELATLERHHNPDDVARSIELARRAGFQRLNIDLIYAVPAQTLESWSKSLEAALALNLAHLSCYGLTYEPNTPMTLRKQQGAIEPAPEELELEMLHYTRQRMIERGLPSYEISNYAVAGEECRHNLHYWTGGSYASLGPSGASHVHGVRFRNRPNLGEWEQAIGDGSLPVIDLEQLSSRQRGGELIMLMLRLARGVHFAEFADRTGLDARDLYQDLLDRLSRQQLLHVDRAHFALTERGINVADAIASEFLQC